MLWDKSWVWDINHCWYNYPHQNLTSDIWWYYMVNMAFYWSLAMSQFFDVKRKDFWQMFVHHIATLMLMGFSWMCNLFRIGSLVIMVHDCADIFLDVIIFILPDCKFLYSFVNFSLPRLLSMLNTKEHATLCLPFSPACGSSPAWLFTHSGLSRRKLLGVTLFMMLISYYFRTSVEAPTIIEMFPAYYIFNFLLLLLLVLHVGWTYLILRIVYNSIMAGQVIYHIFNTIHDPIA